MSENWPPRAVFDRLEASNHRTAVNAAASFASFVGAPVVHAAHAGELRCAMPWFPAEYRGHFEGGTLITDARGRILAAIDRADGEGFAVAAVAWNYQRLHGRPWYRKHVRGRPARPSRERATA
jgi:predicted amidohydrolase